MPRLPRPLRLDEEGVRHAFAPRRGETVQLIFLRFDDMLDRANDLADLNISSPFRTWMLLSLLRLPPKKWSERQKYTGHRFPRNHREYKQLQNTVICEKTLETQVGNLGTDGRRHGQCTYFTSNGHDDFDYEPLPLYLCLGEPSRTTS